MSRLGLSGFGDLGIRFRVYSLGCSKLRVRLGDQR